MYLALRLRPLPPLHTAGALGFQLPAEGDAGWTSHMFGSSSEKRKEVSEERLPGDLCPVSPWSGNSVVCDITKGQFAKAQVLRYAFPTLDGGLD